MIPPTSFFTGGKEKAHTRQRPKRSEPIPVSLAWSMHRSIATPPRRDVSPLHGYTSPPPPQQYVAGSIYTPGWRETKKGKIPCLRKQCDGRGLNSGPPDPKLEPHTHAHCVNASVAFLSLENNPFFSLDRLWCVFQSEDLLCRQCRAARGR